jgi:AGZA family xanthine/uracil permease-like MFS transporter
MWLGIFTGGYECLCWFLQYEANGGCRIMIVLLMMYRVRGAMLIGIFFTSILSWPRPTPITYFPHTALGDAAFDFFKQVVMFHPISNIANALDVCILWSCNMDNPNRCALCIA